MENNTCQFPHFQRSPSTCSKINMMRSVSCCPLCCVNCHFHVASAQNAVCLRAFTLSLDLLAHSVLSPLTFKAPGSKCQQFYKLTEFRPSSSQSQTVWECSLHKLPAVRSPFLTLSVCAALSEADSFLYMVVKIVLPVFGWLCFIDMYVVDT